MSSGKTFISLDALGGDNSPSVVLSGAEKALQADPNLVIDLCGPAEVVEPFAETHKRTRPVVTTQEITMSEHPANAVRRKKDSSIVVGCRRVKEGKSDCFFSAGNTGACLSAATLVTGRIKGVKRPMLATVLPTVVANKTVFFGDVGANADCKPEFILQFAIMAKAYLEACENCASPKIGLLNIGEEDTKGNKLAQETNALLREKLPNFVGNAESRDLFSGEFDAVVTDGFSGNITLKNTEGTAKFLLSLIKESIMSSTRAKLGGLLAKPALSSIKDKLNPDAVGGALLFGVKGACCVGHGSSNEEAICNGILTCVNIARAGVPQVIEKEIAQIKL